MLVGNAVKTASAGEVRPCEQFHSAVASCYVRIVYFCSSTYVTRIYTTVRASKKRRGRLEKSLHDKYCEMHKQ